MVPVEILLVMCWGVFWIYWLATALSMKRGRTRWSRELRIRVVLVVVVVVLVRLGAFRAHGSTTNPLLVGVGLVLVALGLGVAVWARRHLGQNWGPPMTEKDEPELVTTGPYRLVRHPIYSGILLAGVGTAAAVSWTWLSVVAVAAIYFGYSAVVEERLLDDAFAGTYRDYQRSTKMFVPFVL